MVLSKEQKRILNMLLDRYERSATFRGENRVRQAFFMAPEKAFPQYTDGAAYDFFTALNDDIRRLAAMGFLDYTDRNGRILKIRLNADAAEEIYRALGRTPKKNQIEYFSRLFEEKRAELDDLQKKSGSEDVIQALKRYLTEQNIRLKEAKLPEYYDDDRKDYEDLLAGLFSLARLQEEMYVRDLSVRLYRDSKRLEQLKPRMNALLYKYGSFPEKEMILEECGAIRTPSHVMIKGPVVLELGDQKLDVGRLGGDAAFSDGTLAGIRSVKIYGKRLITIENLTNFYRMQNEEESVLLYLGGYHSRTKRTFLQKIHEDNSRIGYLHFGDIDAGGFYIYEHLRRKTGIPFRTYRMDAETLVKYLEFAKKLTENDKSRIQKLKEAYENGTIRNPESDEIGNTLSTMLRLQMKLEQEAVV